MDIDELLAREPKLKELIKLISENPYIERKDLAALAKIEQEKMDLILASAVNEMYILELASQADSSLESRVPKKAYLINPDKEELLEKL